MDTGFIKLYRKITEWEWFDKSEMVHIFIFLLVKANHKDSVWRGINLKKGQLITSLDSIKLSTNLSIQTIRTCLTRLEKSGEINKQTTNKFTVITVCKFDSYHSSESVDFKKTTNKQQTTNKQSTTDKNVKNNKEVKNKEDSIKDKETREPPVAQTGFDLSFQNFLEMRKKIRRPATIRAMEMIKKELETISGGDEEMKIKILDQSTMNSWQGVFPLKIDYANQKEKSSAQKEKTSKVETIVNQIENAIKKYN